MSLTSTELAAIKAARAAGIATVSYGGRTITYRSLKEMDEIIAKAEADTSGGRVSVSLAKFSRD